MVGLEGEASSGTEGSGPPGWGPLSSGQALQTASHATPFLGCDACLLAIRSVDQLG